MEVVEAGMAAGMLVDIEAPMLVDIEAPMAQGM